MNFLTIILIVYACLHILALLFYIPRIIFWFEGLKKQKRLQNDIKNKFALIIPARNESSIIENLLLSIKTQTYPKDLFDVYVVVADKNDKTLELTKEHLPEAKTYVIENQTRKAEALDGCLKDILQKNIKYDDYIIIDADNILTPNFLEEMNNALASKADVIIPRKVTKNWQSSNKKNRNIWCNCSALTWVGVDAMGNKSKSARNYTLALSGQGMLISGRLIEQLNGYPFRSLTEDYEITIACIRNGYQQYYYEYAEIYAEEPITRKECNKRRMRWVQGFAQVRKQYRKEVKNITYKQGKIKKEHFHFLYDILSIAIILATNLVALAVFLITGIVLLAQQNPLWTTSLLYALIAFVVCYAELLIYCFISVLQDKDVNKMTAKEKIALVILYPFVSAEWIWIFIASFCKKVDENWEPVERIKM